MNDTSCELWIKLWDSQLPEELEWLIDEVCPFVSNSGSHWTVAHYGKGLITSNFAPKCDFFLGGGDFGKNINSANWFFVFKGSLPQQCFLE